MPTRCRQRAPRPRGTLLEEYQYDGNGNRQKAVSIYPGAVPLNAELGTNIGCPDATGTAANDQDQLCQYGDYDYVYNLRGQLESRSDGAVTTDYSYDGLGRLKRVTEPGMDIHYVHDALGRRIGKIRDGNLGNLERGWLYRDALNPIARLPLTPGGLLMEANWPLWNAGCEGAERFVGSAFGTRSLGSDGRSYDGFGGAAAWLRVCHTRLFRASSTISL